MFARDLTKKSTGQDKTSGLTDCTVVSLVDERNPNLIFTQVGLDKCQCLMLIANELISIKTPECFRTVLCLFQGSGSRDTAHDFSLTA